VGNTWTDWAPESVVNRRASGRRHYNAWRQFMATARRHKVAELLLAGQTQSEIARSLGVHRSTISRDVAWLRELAKQRGHCPTCGQKH